MKQKRLVSVQDISCIGKCSLTAALPIISAFGIETAVLPTAVLSTHTGGFENYTFKDLTEEIPKITNHWKSLGFEFDAMYSGYLGSPIQLDMVKDFFMSVKTDDNIIFVDPAMADNGVLYNGFSAEFPQKMLSLCAIADIIAPNVTEAAMLCGTEYRERYDEQYIRTMAKKLAETGARTVVITGISIGDRFGAMCYDTKNDRFYSYCRKKIEGHYYGTGDIFSSVLCGALTVGFELENALRAATDFVYESILNTQDELERYKYGVKFEQCLSMITDLTESAPHSQLISGR